MDRARAARRMRRMLGVESPQTELQGEYKQALELGEVLVAYARVMLIGPGGVGKSSLLHGLMNLCLPLGNSTQLADILTIKPGSQTEVQQLWARAIDAEEPWVKVKEEDDINELVGLVLLVANVSKGITKSPRLYQKIILGTAHPTNKAGVLHGIVSETYRRQISSVKNEVVRTVLSRAIEIANKNPRAQAPDFEMLLRVWDCAGQSVYLDILSAFLTPKTLFMLLYDARKDLNDRCISLSHHDGEVVKEQREHVSYLEMLSQWMACINDILTDKQSGSIPDFPRIVTVGTHGDDQEVSAKKDKITENVFSMCEGKAFTHLVGKGFVVNNKSAGEGDHEDPAFKELRKEVYQFAKQSCVTVATPVAWVLFRKVLDKLASTKPVLTYDEVQEIATACSIPSSSLNSVLRFYHDVAVFFYYEHIPSMKGYVIANPQWLVKQLAKLLALEGFEDIPNPALWKPLREQGILVEPLYMQVWKGSELPERAILDLLEKCLLAAPINVERKVHSFPGVEHFVPCALPPCSDDQLSNPYQGLKGTSLHLLFSTGYVPPGYLVRLAVTLSKEKKCHISFAHGIYRNQFTFLFGDANNKIDKVTITLHITSVQVDFTRSVDRKSHNPPFSLAVQEVMNIILACSSDIRQWLPNIKVTTAFSCKTCVRKDHFIEIPANATTQSQLRCQEGAICTLTPAQQCWLSISTKEEVFHSMVVITSAELCAVADEVILNDKLETLAKSLEMTAHLKEGIDGVKLLERWQTDMGQFRVHARSHLVHHLKCTELEGTANRLKYGQLKVEQPTIASSLAQDPLTEKDISHTSRVMCDGDLERLAGALDIPDDDLAIIQSKFKNKETQACKLMCKWQTKTRGNKQRLVEILAMTGYEQAAMFLQGINTPSLQELLQKVKTTKWYRLGLELGIDNYKMQVIEADARMKENVTETALRMVLETWLQICANPLWCDVKNALMMIGETLERNKP